MGHNYEKGLIKLLEILINFKMWQKNKLKLRIFEVVVKFKFLFDFHKV